MAMGTERSKALHNFTFPSGLRWGNRRFLRCCKVGQFTDNDAGSSDHHHLQLLNLRRTTSEKERDKYSPASELVPCGSLQTGSTSSPVSDSGGRIIEGEDDWFAAVREDVKLDDQKAADKLKGMAFKDSRKDGEVSVSLLPPLPPVPQRSGVIPGEGETNTPWNLMRRTAVCKTPLSGFVFGSNGGAGVSGKALRVDGGTEVTDVLPRLRSGGNVAAISFFDRAPVPQHSAVIPGEGETKTPWNLRKRAAACKTPLSGFVFGSNGGASAARVSGKALMADGAATEVTDVSSRLRSRGNVAAICGEKLTREKFSVALSKKEIEEDFLAFTGHKPARRPKKRAKIVQRELDTLFPGSSLTEITADMYKVSEGARDKTKLLRSWNMSS